MEIDLKDLKKCPFDDKDINSDDCKCCFFYWDCNPIEK